MKDSSSQPFMVKVRANRASPRWQSFYMPSVSQTVAVGGRFIGREQDTNGLLIIDLTRITYGVVPRTPSKQSTSSNSPSKASGSGWAKHQRAAKRKRKDEDNGDEKDDHEVASQLNKD